MSGTWHWFVIIGTLGSLAFFLLLLYGNRKTDNDGTTGHEFDGIEEYDNPLPMWWVWMFVLSVVFALGYLAYYPGLGNYTGAGGWTSAGEVAAAASAHEERFTPLYQSLAELGEAALHDDRQARQVGRRLFINHCSTCHGVNGQGAFGFPNLTDDDWLWGDDFETVKTTITHGRKAAMPAWGSALGERGVAEVTQYVLKLAGRSHDTGAAERGATHYQTFCVACHGAGGTGNRALGAANFTNDTWLYGAGTEQIAHTIRHGRNGNMPGFSDVLDPARIHVLSGYVTSLGNKE
jgi:cytochrome c oxidase cbb3-type subunit III